LKGSSYFFLIKYLLLLMDDNQKAKVYDQLMYENDKISNQIASIRGENLEMNEDQQQKINKLQQRQQQIMFEASKLY
jgi:adenylosuccinate synthase